jgi:hypothetical protein
MNMSNENLQKEPPKKSEVRKIAQLDDDIENHDNVLDIITEVVNKYASELQEQESTDSDKVEAEQNRLAETAFSHGNEGYDSHSALGGVTQHRSNDNKSEKSKNLSEAEREQRRLARDVFETRED